MLLRFLKRKIAAKENYFVDENFTGHGIGKYLHMAPHVQHSINSDDMVLEEGMVFTIEPILCLYPHNQLYIWEDNFTIISENNPSAQMEHQVYLGERGAEILTL